RTVSRPVLLNNHARWEEGMPQKHGALRALVRKYFGAAVFATAGLLLAGGASWGGETAAHLLQNLPLPVSAPKTTTVTSSFDISTVDQSTGTYYLADRSNKAVDVAAGESVVTQIFPNNGHAPFAGFTPCPPGTEGAATPGANDCAGPNGVVAVFPW